MSALSARQMLSAATIDRHEIVAAEDRGFADLGAASTFFESGSVGYSETRSKDRLDGIELRTPRWSISPLSVEEVTSSFFEDERRFPKGSVSLDCPLIMRDLDHTWHAADDLHLDRAG